MLSPKTVITKDFARGGFWRRLRAIQRVSADDEREFCKEDDILLNDTVFLKNNNLSYHNS
jgi:hypothetical protein